MKKTKIMYDRDVIGRFNCTGFKFTKLQKAWFGIKFYTKRTIQVLSVMCTLSWAGYAGYTYALSNIAPKTIYAENRVEVPVKEITPVLKRIAMCESGGTQFDKNGQVIMHVNTDKSVDLGKYMINLKYHGKEAAKMGLDLTKEADNEAFALYLYENKGTSDWSASFRCWH